MTTVGQKWYRKNMHHRITAFFACIIGVESILVMSGWVLGIDELTRMLAGGINMKFPTALLFFASAIALYYISREIKDRCELSQVLLPGIALFIFLITSALLAAGIFDTQTGIESLFIKEQSPTESFGSGWPSLFAMISFILFGLACIVSLFPRTNRKKWLKLFGGSIFAIGIISVTGYVLDQPLLYYQFSLATTPISFNSALTFILLGSGLIAVGSGKTIK